MKCRRTILSAAIVAGLGFAAQIQAQEAGTTTEAKQDEVTEIQTVVVTGIRGSLQQSLESKREANAIVDVITAEDVGKFPSTNVAEAMTIIPGVTVDRLFGQGEKVSILGTDPALNRTLLNGQTVASADWFIIDQPGRTFNYTLLPPQIVGKVEVFKSPEARIDEGSIGGTVIVSTRKPLEMESNQITGAAGYLYNDRPGDGDPDLSLMYSWKNKAQTFGIAISAQSMTEHIRRDGLEAYGSVSARDYRDGAGGGGSVNNLPPDWSQPPNPDGSQPTLPASCTGACADTLNANLDARGPNSWSTSYFEQERERQSYDLTMQFMPNDNLELVFNALHVDATYDNTNQSLFAFMGNPWNGLMKMDDVGIENGVINRAHFTNALSVFDVQQREAEVDTNSYDLKGTWTTDKWFVSAQLGTTEASGGTSRQLYGEFLNWSDYQYDIRGATLNPGIISYDNGNVLNNPGAFRVDGGWGSDPSSPETWNTGWGGNVVSKPTTDEEQYAQIDFGLNFDSPIHQVRFGYKYRDHETSQSMSGVSLAAVAGYGDATADMFNPSQVPDNYLSGFFGANEQMRNRFKIDAKAMADWILGGTWLAPWQTMPTPGTFNDPSFVANTFTVGEQIDAYYAQADFRTDRWRGNFGVRYVETASQVDSFACVTGENPCAATGYAPVRENRSYDDILPSVNVAFDATDDLVLRFSAAKVMARPNYADMSPYLWLGDQTLTGGGGNPDIEPYRSTNLDFSAEWYFSPDSILAGSVFYKDISNYILSTTRPETHFNQSRGMETIYQVARPDNAGTAKVQGFTVAYQQNFALGFGLVTNYTYSDGEANTGDRLPYNSEHQVNFSPFWEDDKWNVRLNYGWRSDYFTNIDRGDRLYTDKYSSLDGSIGYKFNDTWGLSFDAMNLLDSEYYSYADTRALPRGVYRTGRRYMATIRFQF
ncbi:iron complex outermembrane receptor protein [Luteimonas cucumeris]|uniref:Iron complex outermembrane receptor protein n=1 Tax=Luteimonas cucumeris TaxID=985012 RepID=A0A562LEB0_9GAMM|nr:TonB-dependent receptor [Luteimonas cucumeris]TWI05896.1 iron complex outermembrane receptor protein [Luteimonas cucumeris]